MKYQPRHHSGKTSNGFREAGDWLLDKLPALTFGATVGAVATLSTVYAWDNDGELERARQLINATVACGETNQEFIKDGQPYVVADERCDKDKAEGVFIYAYPTEARLGAVAVTRTLGLLKARCVMESDTRVEGRQGLVTPYWVRVDLANSPGAIAIGPSRVGYIPDIFVQGEHNLPDCTKTPDRPA